MKKIISAIMVFVVLFSFASFVYAAPVEESIPEGGAGFNATTIMNGATGLNDSTGFVSGILGAIQWIGYAIALGMLIYIGIKYVMSSAQDKADLKNNLVRYIIGVVIIAGASTIFGIIKGIV